MILTRASRKRVVAETSRDDGAENGEETLARDSSSPSNDADVAPGAMVTATTSTALVSSFPHAAMDKDGFLSLVQDIRPKKKRKCRPMPLWMQVKPPLEKLPSEVLQNILGFVDDTKDLLHLVNTVKPFRRAIVPRPDIVVRTAVYNGGSSKSAIESFFDDVRYQRIHIPSTLRLLRVINGVRCERGTDCLHYHLIQQQSCRLLPDNLRHFGMALCQTCFSDLTQDMAKGHVHREFIEESYLNHERLAVVTHQYYRQLMLRQPMEDAATKEPVGSLVPSYKVTQVANTYFFNRRPDMLDQEAHMITERILVHLATEALEDGKKKILANEAAGLHLTSQETPALIQGEGAENEESVSSPGIILVSQDNSTRLKAMVNAYDDAQEGYDAYKRAKKEMTLAHKLSFNRKQKKKHRKKLNGGEKVLRSITEEMGAVDMGAYYQDDFAWLFKCEFDPKGYGRFKIKIVDEILGPIVRAPSTATTEKVTEAIKNLLEKLELLEACDFLGNWADDGIEFLDSQCPCEKAMEEYCKKFISPSELLCRERSSMKRGFLSKIETGSLEEAIYMAIHEGNTRRIYNTDLYWMFAGFVAEEFVHHTSDSFANYLLLATRVWESPTPQFTSSRMWTFSTFKQTFLFLRERYRALVENVHTYLMLGDTVRFLAEQGPPAHRPDQLFTRQDAIDFIWTKDPTNTHLLDGRRFDELLEFHREIFDNPRKFGMNPYERP